MIKGTFARPMEFRSHTNFYCSPSCSGYPISALNTNFQANRKKLKIRPFFRTSKFRSHTNFIITIMFRIPDIPKIQNFKPIGQSWKFAPFFSWRSKFRSTQKFYYHHHVQNTRYTQNTKFQANRTRLKFREFSEFRAKTKNRRIFLLVPLYSEYPIYPKYKISSESDKVENSTFFRTAEISRIQLFRKIQVVHADLQTFI